MSGKSRAASGPTPFRPRSAWLRNTDRRGIIEEPVGRGVRDKRCSALKLFRRHVLRDDFLPSDSDLVDGHQVFRSKEAEESLRD